MLFEFQAGVDFNSTLQEYPIEFAAGGMPGDYYCVNVSIIDDMVVEDDEYFSASLNANQSAVFHTEFTRIRIIDNDGNL